MLPLSIPLTPKHTTKQNPMTFKKHYPFEDCPECGNSLTLITDNDPKYDNDGQIFLTDGDEVECDTCDFASSITVSCDGETYIQD